MKRTLMILILLIAALAVNGCSTSTNSRTTTLSEVAPVAPAAPRQVQPAPATGGTTTTDQTTGVQTSKSATADRMIVYTVQLGLEVQDTEKAVADITALVTQQQGYIATTNLTRDSKGLLRGSISVRVPATGLADALKQIKAVGLKVLSENSNANDVTDQYSDLNAQLKNLEATETELRKLLETVRERTGKAEEILAVYNRLTEIRGQIERIKGQINVLSKTSTLATVTIQLTPKQEVQVLDPDTWAPNRTAAQALRTLIQALQGLADLTITLVLLVLPLGIVLALPFVVFVLIIRSIIRRRKKAKVTPTT